MKFQGIFVDTTTPFDSSGALYRVKIEHNIGKWNRTSVAGYVVGGFAGEGALLSEEEKSELWKLAAAAAGPEKLLIAGVDTPGTHVAAAQVNRAAELGYRAALVETPRCDNPQLYFRSVADRAAIPILIANCPDAAALAAHPNICGIVDYSGDSSRIANPSALPVLCGAAGSVWEALAKGASGAVLAFANAAPYAAIALWEAYRTREEEAGLDWQARIAPPAALVGGQRGIPGLKHAMDLNGYYGGPPRLPWTIPSPAEKIRIEEAFAGLNS